MKSLLSPRQILARVTLGLILLVLALPGVAQGQEYVLLADSIKLADVVHDELQYLLEETPNDIEIDEQQQALFTEEGEQIDFSEVFHQNRMRGSQAVSIIFEEYAPDFLVIAWSASDDCCADSSYGVSQKNFEIRLRVLDSSGRNVHKESASIKSKLGVSQPTLEEFLADTVAKLDFDQLENAIAKHTERMQKRGQPIRVVFENVSQKDYFEKQDDLIELLRGAGTVGKIRDQHDKGTKTLTVRTALKGDLDEFYRGLYRSALDSAGLDNFELDRKGNLFVFKALPPTRKRLVISGLSSDQYHHRLEIYREAIASVEDVKQVDFEFVQGEGSADSKLVFAFTYPDDIHVLEEQLWKRLESAGEAINRQLVAVSDTSIQYSAGTDVSDLRQVTLRVGRVDRNAFRRIDPPLESSLQSLRARNLSKTYDDKSRELLYHFQIGETTESLTASIESTIEATPALDKLVVESIGANLIAFSYQAVAPASLPATVELHGLNEQDYQTVGREFAALIEGIRGVERLRQDYSPAERVLQLRFHYQGKISLSQYLYRLILQSPSLAGLSVTQSSGKITLTPLPPERRRLVIAGLSAERYHHRLEAYRTAITSQEGVTEAAHEYLAGGAGEPGQLVFSFNFSGNLAVLEDHIWASLVATGETPNRQLTAVSERLIQYQAGGEAVLTAVFRNVAAAEYSRVREALDSIFGNLEVRNLTRDYNDKTRVLSYNFESGQAMVELDATLGQQIEIEPALQGLVPGIAANAVLEYNFLKTIVTVAFNNIAPEDYRKIGALLDTIIKQLVVKDLKKAYDPNEYRLSYTLESPIPPVELDTILWEKIRGEKALSNIAQDTTSEDTLGYFYLQKRPDTRSMAVVLENLGPDAYRKAGLRFVSAIKVIEGVDRVQREYSENDQVLRLRFRYRGESIYAIDDAIWKAVRRDKTFTDLALGSMTEAKLVYVLGAVEGIQPDVIIHLRRVSGADYKIVATGFSKLLGRLKNVRDVRYHYLFQQRTIVFRLRYGGEDLFTLDDAIQHSLAAHQLFQQVAKGPDTAGRMIYLFGEEPVVVQSGEPAVVTVEPNESAALPSSGSLPDLVAALDQTVIVVLGESEDARWHGTGFFVTDSGYILTNAHVAMGHLVHEGKAKLWAKTLDGHRYPLNVIKSDNEQDLALLKIVSPTRQFKSVKIGNSSQLRKGQQVFNIGNPGTWDEHFEHSVTIGVVAGLNRNDGLIEFSMPGRGGQSGSPVFNTAGTVVGVVVKVTLDDSGKALIPVLMATVDTSGKASFKVENKLIDVMTRNETITMAIPINHARNLLQLTGP